MQVELRAPQVSGPIELVMSRSSPGRYALHEFVKNVFDVRATDGSGRALPLEHPAPNRWRVAEHDGTVSVHYRVYGDRVDGTYLAVDTSHAHVNVPAALMWVRGLEARPVTVVIVPPAESGWRVATQLFPTGGPVHVHRARSRVPGRQPDRGQPSRPARLPCTGGRRPRAEPADVPGAARAERAR